MIFVTVGTHPGQFDRLVRRMDFIAPQIKEKIIIQRGFTKYVPKNVESFDFTDNVDKYFSDARLVIVQSATSLLEFVLKYPHKPVMTVPRQARFKEHINDHQVEFAVFFAEKTGIKNVLNIEDITPKFLKEYKKTATIKKENLIKLQSYLKSIIQ